MLSFTQKDKFPIFTQLIESNKGVLRYSDYLKFFEGIGSSKINLYKYLYTMMKILVSNKSYNP